MDNALTAAQTTAIEQAAQSLQLQSIAHNTKRTYVHAATHFLNWIEGIEQPSKVHGDLDELLTQVALRFSRNPDNVRSGQWLPGIPALGRKKSCIHRRRPDSD